VLYLPALQSVQAGIAVPVLYFPATQLTQVDMAVIPKPVEEVPMPHPRQVLESVAPTAVLYLPALQFVQAGIAVPVWNCPARQLMQVDMTVIPKPVEKVPALHAVHAEMAPTALLNLPARQLMQAAVPDVRYWPAVHCAPTAGRSHSSSPHRAGNERRQPRARMSRSRGAAHSF
jgi:hypothetical protein